MITTGKEKRHTSVKITDRYVPAGTNTVHVSDANGLAVGVRVDLRRCDDYVASRSIGDIESAIRAFRWPIHRKAALCQIGPLGESCSGDILYIC